MRNEKRKREGGGLCRSYKAGPIDCFSFFKPDSGKKSLIGPQLFLCSF